ncbi:MAG: hypothetical protein WCK34_02325, partial [Bacteroidota bacterium]
MAEKFHFECTDCKTKYPGEGTIYLCPSCDATNIPGKPPKGVLKTVYNYQRIRSEQSIDTLFDWLESQSFLPLLPLHGMDSWPPLRIGYTPLYRVTPETTENPGGQLNGREDKPNAGKV